MARPGPSKGKSVQRKPPDGQVRKSQSVSTYGPGALVDLIDSAVLIGGLDFWHFKGGWTAIKEPRLREAVAKCLPPGRTLDDAGAFREPPESDPREPTFQRGIEAFRRELSKVRTGRANLALLDGIKVEYYGTMTPLNQVATMNVPDARLITIKPWEKSLIPQIGPPSPRSTGAWTTRRFRGSPPSPRSPGAVCRPPRNGTSPPSSGG